MWALLLEYQTHNGLTMRHHMPLFNSAAECLWWAEYLWSILEHNGAHDAAPSECKFFPKTPLN